jgi:hypothetical protein
MEKFQTEIDDQSFKLQQSKVGEGRRYMGEMDLNTTNHEELPNRDRRSELQASQFQGRGGKELHGEMEIDPTNHEEIAN